MASGFVLDYQEIECTDFKQASIYLDACFILAYLDSNDARGDKVADIIDKWNRDGIKELSISNHVISEVVHNLLKLYIRNVLAIGYKIKQTSQSISPYIPSKDEQELVGDILTARRLTDLIPTHLLTTLMKTGELRYSIEDLLKQYKLTYPNDRDTLSHYYNKSIERFNEFISGLGFKTRILVSDREIKDLSFSHMRLFQLSSTDAMHIALTVKNEIDYFATLDSDFVHTYYTEETIGKVRVLSVA
ncbi:hypothetical protein [Evansella tamaricis]|uniref:PIN domain-containing protein n=1 Tax=Evansella tamaricis TaxID=2069301 RepID=A0ABS6JMM8_9BACI|nr:hypothetical protein [Evansella tamaricis]MBU9714097.1 hypothetical protein [Evansella tamaricis]